MSKKNKNKPNKKPSIPSGNSVVAIKPKWQHILLIILLTTIVYSNTLHNEFVYDDRSTIVENHLIRDLNNIVLFFTTSVQSTASGIFGKGYRPLTMSSFAINYAIGKLDVAGYHVVNIFLHTANALLLYMMIIMILNIHKGIPDGCMVALLTSLIFVVHPINTEAVNYVWQRSVLMATFFYLAAFIFFIKQQEKDKQLFYILSIIAYIFALASKEIAITFPIILLLTDWYLISKFKKDVFIKSIKKYHMVFIVITFLYILMRLSMKGVLKELDSVVQIDWYRYFITQLRVIVMYFRMLIFPYGLSVDHSIQVSKSIIETKVLLSLIFLITIILTSVKLVKSSKIVSLFMLWFFISLVPTSSILALNIIMNEHRVYLPGIGIITTFVILLYKYCTNSIRKRILPVFLSVVIVVFSVISFQRNAEWKNKGTLWASNLNTYPDSERALINTGIYYVDNCLYDKAIENYNKALDINPTSGRIYANRGVAYFSKGDEEKALIDFNKAINLDSEIVIAYKNRAAIYFKRGVYNKALSDFNKIIEINPGNPEHYLDRGSVYTSMNELDNAVKEYNKAFAISPRNPEIYNERGVVYGMKGLYNKAIEDFNNAIRLNKKYAEAYNNRSLAYKLMGKPNLAKQDEEKVKSLMKRE